MNRGIALARQTAYDAVMSGEIEELKSQLQEYKNLVNALEGDVQLLMQYSPNRILRNSEHVGDTAFNQDLAQRSRDFVKRHGLRRG